MSHTVLALDNVQGIDVFEVRRVMGISGKLPAPCAFSLSQCIVAEEAIDLLP